MTKEKLQEMASRYQEKADRAYMNYQETGITRYDRERRNAEDLADALRMAAYASDDHDELCGFKGMMSYLAAKASRIKYMPDDQKEKAMDHVLNELLAEASMKGLISAE